MIPEGLRSRSASSIDISIFIRHSTVNQSQKIQCRICVFFFWVSSNAMVHHSTGNNHNNNNNNHHHHHHHNWNCHSCGVNPSCSYRQTTDDHSDVIYIHLVLNPHCRFDNSSNEFPLSQSSSSARFPSITLAIIH